MRKISIAFLHEKIKGISVFNSIFAITLLYIFIKQIVDGFPKDSWNITEWLINYQGGFVRRGLTGEVILDLYKYFGLSPYIVILFISILAYIILIFFFVKHFLENRLGLSILLYPFFLGGPIINNFLVRKDILIILIFIFIIYLSIGDKKYLRDSRFGFLQFIIINIIFSFGLLVHEELGFLVFPILLLLFISKNKERHTIIKSVFLFSSKFVPSIVTFFLCLYYKGSPTISNSIWISWKSIPFPFQNNDVTIPAAIDALSWSIGKGLSFPLKIIKNFSDGIYAPLAWFIIILLIYFLLSNMDNSIPGSSKLITETAITERTTKFTKANMSNILFFQLLSVIPLFILGWDYGRWIFLWVASSFSIMILLPNEISSNLFPKFITNLRNRIDNILTFCLMRIRSQESLKIIMVFLGIPGFSWSMSLYLSATPIIIELVYISKLIQPIVIAVLQILIN